MKHTLLLGASPVPVVSRPSSLCVTHLIGVAFKSCTEMPFLTVEQVGLKQERGEVPGEVPGRCNRVETDVPGSWTWQGEVRFPLHHHQEKWDFNPRDRWRGRRSPKVQVERQGAGVVSGVGVVSGAGVVSEAGRSLNEEWPWLDGEEAR